MFERLALFGLPVLLGVLAIIAYLDGGIVEYPQLAPIVEARSKTELTGAACKGSETCLVHQAPIASFDEARRCGTYVESGRLGPDQIACSESWVTDKVLKIGDASSSFYRKFRRGCRTHDFCYVHAAATYLAKADPAAVRAQCDRTLLADVIRDCRLMYPTSESELRTCYWHAMAAFAAIRTFGGSEKYFSKAKTPTCDYEPGRHAARDQVVNGRFELGAPDRAIVLTELADGAGISVEVVGLETGQSVTRAQQTIKMSDVAIPDAAVWCDLVKKRGGPATTCPSTLADIKFKSASWLELAPIVIDSDGDGVDEIVLLTTTESEGLVLTHLRTTGTGTEFKLDVPRAYLAVDDVGHFLPHQQDAGVSIMERSAQLFQHRPVVISRAPADCADIPAGNPEDIAMIGSVAQVGRLAFSHSMMRIYFDANDARWHLLRDRFAEDGRAYAKFCKPHGTKLFDHADQVPRLQYPAFATTLPVKCLTRTITRDLLTTIERLPCSSSTVHAVAGDLNDLDLVLYRMNADFKGEEDQADPVEKFQIARAFTVPLQWNEAADPTMSSRAARRLGIVMASVYAGGTRDGVYPLITVLKADERLKHTIKDNWRYRMPDTMGLVPEQYALLTSKPREPNIGWDQSQFGPPGMFLQLPSLLAPFWIDGSSGVSMVLVANTATRDRNYDSTSDWRDRLKEGTIHILIVPLVNDKPSTPAERPPLGEPRWLECPVPDYASLGEDRAVRPEEDWRRDFMHSEPALTGQFFGGDKPGGLAISYRTRSGQVRFVGLRNDAASTAWTLGGKACQSLSRDVDGKKQRDIWMMKLN